MHIGFLHESVRFQTFSRNNAKFAIVTAFAFLVTLAPFPTPLYNEDPKTGEVLPKRVKNNVINVVRLGLENHAYDVTESAVLVLSLGPRSLISSWKIPKF